MSIFMKSSILNRLVAAAKARRAEAKKKDENTLDKNQETIKKPEETLTTHRTNDLALTLAQSNLISQQNLIKFNINQAKEIFNEETSPKQESTAAADKTQSTKHISEKEAVAQGYVVIKTVDDLKNINNNLSGKYMLMGNIDLSSVENWAPIGSNGKPFKGVLNGNGFEIQNLTVSKEKEGAGLFASLKNATVKDLNIKNADITNKGMGGKTNSMQVFLQEQFQAV